MGRFLKSFRLKGFLFHKKLQFTVTLPKLRVRIPSVLKRRAQGATFGISANCSRSSFEVHESESGCQSRVTNSINFPSALAPVLSYSQPNETGNQTDESETIEDLIHHYFVEGTVNLAKKTPCDLDHCPFRKKVSKSQVALPSGKETLICKDCGLTIHLQCIQLIRPEQNDCFPDLYKIPEIFGTDLTTLVKATLMHTLLSPEPEVKGNASEMESQENQLPQAGPEAPLKLKLRPSFVIEKCVTELERRGLGSEGIYRLNGGHEMSIQLQSLLERDRLEADLSASTDSDSICSVLKLYLRLLPEPLITREVFTKFLHDFEENVGLNESSVRANLSLLPLAHKVSLSYLLAHLEKVVGLKDQNRMSPYALSSVLVPSLIVPAEMSLATLEIGTGLVEFLIKAGPSIVP